MFYVGATRHQFVGWFMKVIFQSSVSSKLSVTFPMSSKLFQHLQFLHCGVLLSGATKIDIDIIQA